MYPIDERDRLGELPNVPKPEPGAPCPILLAEENRLVVSYWLPEVPPYDTGPTGPFAFVRFHGPYFHLFGSPNDEALDGHPLSKCGLAPYSVYEVESSSLIRRLEAMNAVHPYHRPAVFDAFHHYVFTFHDSTFECVAHGLESFVEHIHSDQQLQRMSVLLTG